MSVALSGCCCDFRKRDNGAFDEMHSEHSSAEGMSRRQCPVVLFRCLGICQLGLGVGIFVCGLIIGILGSGWYSWGSLLIGILEVTCCVLCLLATCRRFHTEETTYKRFASCQLRIHFWIAVCILLVVLPGLITTGIGGLATCNGTGDECKNHTYVKNASIAAIIFMILSVFAIILFIYLSCVIGEEFGMGYDIHTGECGVPNIGTIGADEVLARQKQKARRKEARYAHEMYEDNLTHGSHHLNARDLLEQQQQQQQHHHGYQFHMPPPPITMGAAHGGASDVVMGDINVHVVGTNQANLTTYDVVCLVDSEVAKLTSILEEAHEQVVIVDRHNIVDDVINLYTDPEILRTRIKVQFKDELGDDFGGLTKDMFTQFWKNVQDDCFTGCDTLIPRLPDHREHDIIMAAIGKVVSHMLMLRGKVPYAFCRCSLLAAAAPESVISKDLLLEDFLLYSEADDKAILKKVIDNTDELTDAELDKLTDLFVKYGQQVMPHKDILIARDQIATIAKAEFCNKPLYLLQPMRTGLRMTGTLANFWDNMNEEKIRVLFTRDDPTADRVIACLTVNRSLRNREQFSLDLLKIFLKDTESTLLTPFLILVTGSADLPAEGIQVTFNDTSGAGRRPCFHTCGNVLELSMNYVEYDEFKREMEEVLTNPAYLEMGLR